MKDIFNKVPGELLNDAIKEVAPALNKAAQDLNNYILSPIQRLGIAGFMFDKIVSSNVITTTQYSRNTAENGAFLTDHSITEPKQITITGYVGEKVYSTQPNPNLLAKLGNKLPVILNAAPKLTKGMQQLKNALDKVKEKDNQDSINSSVDFWNTLKSLIPPKTKSGKAYAFFEALRLTNAVLSLTEPDGTYHINMVITRIDKTTREDTNDIIDFVVELQEWRTADTLYSPFDKSSYASKVAEQKAPITYNGQTQAVDVGKKLTSTLAEIKKVKKNPSPADFIVNK